MTKRLPCRRRRGRAGPALLFALALVTGCDAPPPTAARTPSPAPRRPEISAPVDLGTSDVPIPATDGFGVLTDWVQLGPVIPDSSWAVLRISGTVSYTINPDCQNSPYVYLTACGDLDGKQTGEWFYNGSSHVDLATVPPGTAPHLPIAMFTDDADADAGISLVRNTSGGPWNVYAYRHISHHGIYSTLTGFGPAGNFLGGRQTVRVTRIPSPLVLTGPDAVAPGDSAGFDARPFDGLRFYDPNQFDPAQAWVSWDFFPGDTGEVHRDGWTEDTGCSGVLRTHCSFTPREAGRLFVSAYVMGRWVVEDRVLRTGDPQCSAAGAPSGIRTDTTAERCGTRHALHLECSPSGPVRGDTVRCTTTVTPATAFTLVRRTATGAGDSLHIVETLNATYAAGSAAVWTGPALVATRVQVFAMVPGERDTLADSTEFRPIPRTWEPYRITDSRVDTAVDTRGGMRPWPTDGTAIGTWYLYALQITSTPVFRADDGPNRGVAVFAERPDFEDPHITHIYLHPAIFTPETSNLYQRWYRQQDGRPEGTCDQQQMLQLRAEELRHEGVTYAPDSHNGIAQAWLDREKWQKYFESQRVVDMDESALRENAVYRWTASGEQMYNAQYAFDAQEYQLIYVDRLKCLLDPGVK